MAKKKDLKPCPRCGDKKFVKAIRSWLSGDVFVRCDRCGTESNSITEWNQSTFYNPCYHCYVGAIGECAMTQCKNQNQPWSKDVVSKQIEIKREAM